MSVYQTNKYFYNYLIIRNLYAFHCRFANFKFSKQLVVKYFVQLNSCALSCWIASRIQSVGRVKSSLAAVPALRRAGRQRWLSGQPAHALGTKLGTFAGFPCWATGFASRALHAIPPHVFFQGRRRAGHIRGLGRPAVHDPKTVALGGLRVGGLRVCDA